MTSIYDHPQNVYELQTALRFLRRTHKIMPLINPDGIYGPQTTEAVAEAQRYFGLLPTGRADYEIWKLLFENYFGF